MIGINYSPLNFKGTNKNYNNRAPQFYKIEETRPKRDYFEYDIELNSKNNDYDIPDFDLEIIDLNKELEEERRLQEKQRNIRYQKRLQRAKERRRRVLITRAGAILTALGITAAGTAVIKGGKPNPPTPIQSEEGVKTETYFKTPAINTARPDELEFAYVDQDGSEIYTGEYAFSDAASLETPAPEENSSDVEEIFASNEEVKRAYNDINEAIERFSSQLGEDGLSLIKNRVEAIGGGNVEVADVLKVLYIESRGRIYEADGSGNILESYTGEAFGPFQLTPDTASYLNKIYGLNLDLMNPRDNLDLCIYDLRFLNKKRAEDLEVSSLPTGESVKDAIIWSYHDGAWATRISDNAKSYIEEYHRLSSIDEFEPVLDLILENN